MKYLITLIAFSFYFYTSNPVADRKVAQTDDTLDLKQLLYLIKNDLNEKIPNHTYCYEKIQNYYQDFFQLNYKKSGLADLGQTEKVNLVELSFQMRLEIRKKLQMLDPQATNFENCLSSIRALTRVLRYSEDYLVENLYADEKFEYQNLQGRGIHFLVNPAFKFNDYSDLESGDVIISRGNAYTSAAIARIGADDAQFSHASFVAKLDDDNLYTSEAHIEIGSVFEPIQVHIDQKNARTVVFRYKNQKLASDASIEISKLVSKNQQSGKNIEYDFGMDYRDNERLFCSEVIYAGFKLVDSNSDIPIYKTKFARGLIPFLNQMGIEVDSENIEEFKTFAPGDLEFDPNFELVAEWRHPSKITKSRIKDAILTKMFEWMEHKKYEFKPKFSTKSKSYLAWILRRTPFIRKSFEEKFPLNMRAKQLQLFVELEDVAFKIENELNKIPNISKYSFEELFEEIEELRQKDHEAYMKGKKHSLFHKSFHADY